MGKKYIVEEVPSDDPEGCLILGGLGLGLGLGALAIAIAVAIYPLLLALMPWVVLLCVCYLAPVVGIPALIMSIFAARGGVSIGAIKARLDNGEKWKWLRYWLQLWGNSIIPTLTRMIVPSIICTVITAIFMTYVGLDPQRLDNLGLYQYDTFEACMTVLGGGIFCGGILLPLLPAGITTLKYRNGKAPESRNGAGTKTSFSGHGRNNGDKGSIASSGICPRCGGLMKNGVCPYCGTKF